MRVRPVVVAVADIRTEAVGIMRVEAVIRKVVVDMRTVAAEDTIRMLVRGQTGEEAETI